jgi:hypothetical protein
MKILVGSILIVASLWRTRAQLPQPCPNDEEALEFRFFTDAQSFLENGWQLQCEFQDGTVEIIWDVLPGSLPYTYSTEVIRDSVCVAPTTSCWLTVIDLEGDGLLAQHFKDGFTGWFALLYGSRTVALYSDEPTPAFSELHYCVGPKCQLTPNRGEKCVETYLYMQMDGRPQDTRYELKCNGQTQWKRSGLSQPGEVVEEEACILNDMCCTFALHDAAHNGMTTPTDNGYTGFAYLEWNYEGLLEYDGVTGEVFETKSVVFGHGCRESWHDDATDIPRHHINETATFSDHGSVDGRPLKNDISTTRYYGGLSDTTKIVLFTLAGLLIFFCLVVVLFYRHVLLMRANTKSIHDEPTIVGSVTVDESSFQG